MFKLQGHEIDVGDGAKDYREWFGGNKIETAAFEIRPWATVSRLTVDLVYFKSLPEKLLEVRKR
jgi:hypothetical protein